MANHSRFQIKEFKNPSGETVYRVSGTKHDGERVRKNYQTREEAVGEQNRLETEFLNEETALRPRLTSLDESQLREAETAYKDLKGAPLPKAIRYFLDNYREPVTEITVGGAYSEFYKVKSEIEKCRTRTLQNINSRVGSFATKHRDVLFSAVTHDQITAHITRGGATNQNNNRRELSAFFNWGMKKGYCAKNLVLETQTVRGEDKDIAALTVPEVRKLIEAAQTYVSEQKTGTGKVVRQETPASDGGLIPFLTIGLFAGLRPDEIARLNWDSICLEEKQITVTSGKAKTRKRRVVEMSDNLVEWLTPFKLKRRPIFWTRLNKHFRRMRINAGFRPAEKSTLEVAEEHEDLKPWIQDYCRHTAVSAHLAHHKSEDKTALWAGHAVDVMHGNYKGLMSTKEATEFWQIRPETAKVVKVKFKKAA